MIRKRILDKEFDRNIAVEEGSVEREKNEKVAAKKKAAFQEKRINLMIDISKNLKAKESQAYERALVSANIDTMAKTLNYLIERKIQTPEEFQIYVSGIRAEYELIRKELRSHEDSNNDLKVLYRMIQGF